MSEYVEIYKKYNAMVEKIKVTGNHILGLYLKKIPLKVKVDVTSGIRTLRNFTFVIEDNMVHVSQVEECRNRFDIWVEHLEMSFSLDLLDVENITDHVTTDSRYLELIELKKRVTELEAELTT